MAVSRSRRWTVARAGATCLVAALAVAAAGCGKKGNPLPPMRFVPNATTDLAVSQRGNQIVLRFGYPQTTTSGAKLPGLSAVEVAEMTRQVPADAKDLPIVDPREFAGGAKSVAKLSGDELTSAIEGGAVVVRLPLPEAPPAAPAPTPAPTPAEGTAAPAAGPPRAVYVYAVRTTAKGDHDHPGETSAWSNLARLAPQAPPAPPSSVSVEPKPHGIQLTWADSGATGITGFGVYRRAAESRSYGAPIKTLPADARGYLDETPTYGQRYIYAVVTSVSAAGAPDSHIESALSEEREVDYEDRFPPAPPEGLEALPQSGGTVSLVWQVSPDHDAAGYRVYRADPGADFRLLTSELIKDLKYVDSGLAAGAVFRYRLTAVDGVGNEGPPTPVVEARAQ
jgi:hypothetical protein